MEQFYRKSIKKFQIFKNLHLIQQKYKLKYQLMCLISTTNNILKKNWRKYNYGWKYRRFTKVCSPKCILSKYLLKNLCSNQDYQRNLSIKHVQRAAANFDLYQINPVKVSRRDGINYVFNGQHTIEIVALVSGSRETPVWCMVYDDLVYTQEADIFANQMKYVKSLLPYEIFMANIEAGNDRELIIRDLVESYDLSITSSSRPGGICAVSTFN